LLANLIAEVIPSSRSNSSRGLPGLYGVKLRMPLFANDRKFTCIFYYSPHVTGSFGKAFTKADNFLQLLSMRVKLG
jgi:hypothetical protein